MQMHMPFWHQKVFICSPTMTDNQLLPEDDEWWKGDLAIIFYGKLIDGSEVAVNILTRAGNIEVLVNGILISHFFSTLAD